MTRADFFRQALTSRELKVKPKTANVAGLQLADLLGHPVRQSILLDAAWVAGDLRPFARRLLSVVEGKFNRQLYTGQVAGYGTVLFPGPGVQRE